MARKLMVLLAACFVAAVGCSPATETESPSETSAPVEAEAPAQATIETDTHIFEEIADGVYFATGAGSVNVASNALVVVNEEDVLVVDSHITPDAARALLQSVKTLTDKPIRYLVNSHFHFDHAHGNQVFPDVDIIGHEYTREKLLGDPLSEQTYQVIGSPEAQSQLVAALDAQIEAAADSATALALNAQKAMLERHIVALDEVVPTPPNITFVRRLSIKRDSREILLLHLGRGHTGGDVVVYLPAERVLFTGDLLYPGAPYLGDGFADEFPETLEQIKALDVDVIAGGHGALMRDTAIIDRVQTYLRTYWSQVSSSHDQGLSVADAVAALDLSGYEDFAAFQLGTPGVLELEVGRMYERLEEIAAGD